MPLSASASLDIMERASDPVAAIRAAFDLAQTLSSAQTISHRNRLTWSITRRPAYQNDYLYRGMALHLLGLIGGDAAVEELCHALDGVDGTEAYAAGAVVGQVSASTVAPLLRLLESADPFTRFQAQQALLTSPTDGPASRSALAELRRIAQTSTVIGARVAAIELLSRVPNDMETVTLLSEMATARGVETRVRGAALRAVGDMRIGAVVPELIQAARAGRGEIQFGAVEALGEIGGRQAERALCELLESRNADRSPRDAAFLALQRLRRVCAQPPGGLTVAQFTFPASIDAELNGAGHADSGGIAALLLSLGRALARQSRVSQVFTVSRASVDPETGSGLTDTEVDGATLVRLPIGPSGQISPIDLWPYVFQMERGLERYFSTQPPLDAFHVRFANAGTWAGARWARRRNIPLHFTLAPDPYVPLQRAAERGDLTRASFGAVDRRERYLFRAIMLEWMARHADGLAILPREQWKEEARVFFGLDLPRELSHPNGRAGIIAEGIELKNHIGTHPFNRSADWLTKSASPGYGHGLPPSRTGLPVIVSVGRLHPVKGMSNLVAAWAADPDLSRNFNLIVIGGDITNPAAVERRVLGEIEAVLVRFPAAGGGLLLPGAQPHRAIAPLLTSLRDGIPGLTAPHAIYACASDKEEFGLAILEAMAAGLIVVAPLGGGPGTYLCDGVAGFMTDTSNTEALASTLRRAADVRARPEARAEMTVKLTSIVETRFSIDRMASELTHLYERPFAKRQQVS